MKAAERQGLACAEARGRRLRHKAPRLPAIPPLQGRGVVPRGVVWNHHLTGVDQQQSAQLP